MNGRVREVAPGATVAALISELGFRPANVVVERNGEPLERARFSEVALEPGDVVEIVRPVQGGDVSSPADARLYLVAPGGLETAMLDAVVAAGVGLVQLRMKEALANEILFQAERYREVCNARGVPFVVNDRPDIAKAAYADGVHLGQEDLPPVVARDILGPQAIIGRSTHSVEDIERGRDEHARGVCDYIAVGPVYATPTAPTRAPVGLELVRYAAEHVTFPWFAIGGIDTSNVGEVVAAGARRIVVVRAITLASDPAAVAKELRGTLR